MKKKYLKRKALTLIEILLALTLIGIFLSVIGSGFLKSFWQGKQKITLIEMKNIETAVRDFYRVCGFYPKDIQSLVEKPTDKDCKNWSSFLEKMPKDQWGNDYQYKYEGGKIHLKSFGLDGAEGGEGEDADISNEDE